MAEQFASVPGYLNTASVGLAPRVGLEAAQAHLEVWRLGSARLPSFDADVGRARAAYARLAGVEPAWVGIVSQVSVASAMVARSLPEGARVLGAREDFASLLFPFMADRRLDVRLVPLDELPHAVAPGTALVAVSAVQSADGRLVDVDGLVDAARAAGARTYLDVTQSAGWLPLDLSRFDVTACGAYKWLCCPRGTGFITARPDVEWLTPLAPGWYSADDPWSALYGAPLRVAPDARRFGVSPVWLAMAAAAPTLEMLAGLDPGSVRSHCVGLANDLRRELGMASSDSAIVSVDTPRAEGLAAGGVTAATRAGRARLSFFLYNSSADVDRAASLLGPDDGPV